MDIGDISRRGFAGVIGAAIGATLVEGRLASLAAAQRPGARPAVPAGPIRLNANENPYGPSPLASKAIADSVRLASRYPDELARELKEMLARQHEVKVEQVLLGCGSTQILQMADSAYLGSGKKVVAAEPTFEAVLEYAGVMQAEPVKIAQTADFRHDLAKMASACDGRTGLVYVCNPNNPTGTIVSGEELSAFVSRVPASTMILVDEAYHHFVEDEGYRSSLELLERAPNLVVARTFSKIYGLAGMRLGYAVASPAVIQTMERYASQDNVNAAVLSAALASVGDRNLVPSCRKTLNGTRGRLCRELGRDGRRYIPSHANFMMIDVESDVVPVIRAFRERNIHVGRKFPSMANWLRITIGRPEEMNAFLQGLRDIVPERQRAA
jgi:histidinol-phosphate aminotransferase